MSRSARLAETALPSPSFWDEWNTLLELRTRPELLDRIRSAHGSELSLQATLRKEYSEDVVRAALVLLETRQKARHKFSRADQMWFDRQGFEQATAEPVARHKAARFDGRVWDLCCGIGADAIALAQRGETAAVDRNPACCLRAQWNAAIYDASRQPAVICGDVLTWPLAATDLVHIDPDRRAGSSRVVRLDEYVPGPEFLTALAGRVRGGAIKLSPAANFGGKFPGSELELISLHGECKEATIWFGALAGTGLPRATVLPSGETLTGDPLEAFAPVGPLSRHLFDPDPAIVRAGLVDVLAERMGLSRLDESEEYLTGDEPLDSPFWQRFEVLAELPNNPRLIRAHFRESQFGQVEIKCRHIPIDVEGVRRQLPLPGTESGVLFYARLAGKARAIVARRAP